MLQSRLVRYSLPLCRRICFQQCNSVKNFNFSSNVKTVRAFSISTRKNGSTDEAVKQAVESVPFLLKSEVAGKIVDPSFADMGLATGWLPYNYIQGLYEFLHNTFDQPWWATIAVATLAVRLLTFPLYISSKKFAINSNNKREGQQKLVQQLEKAKLNNDYMKKIVMQKKLMEYMKKHKIGPGRMLITIPLPLLFMSCMIAIRKMTQLPIPSLDAESFFWVSSLCAPDPYRIIPLTAGIVLGFTLRSVLSAGHADTRSDVLRKLSPYLPFLPPVFFVLLLGKTASIVSMYILVNGIFTWGSTLLILNPTVKKAFNIPEHIVKPAKNEERKGILSMYKDLMKDSQEKSKAKAVVKQFQADKKRQDKERKKELKRDPPITFEIGSEAKERVFVPDFEREWKPKLTRRQDYM